MLWATETNGTSFEMDYVNTQYFDQLLSKSLDELQHEFNLRDFNFSGFEYINAYLLYQAFFNECNILIKLLEKEDKTSLYVPTIFILSIINFFKNYTEYKPEIKVGDILQRDGITYKVTKISENRYTLKAKDKCDTTLTIHKKIIETFIKTTGELKERKAKTKFSAYKNFFDSIFKLEKRLPSEFQYKSIIVTSKEIIKAVKEFRWGTFKIHKAFPFEYISKSGIPTPNLPIDPMIYIVNDYETVREHIFGKKHIKIDTVVLIGAIKYREYISNISNDLRSKKFNNCIFIGSEEVENFQNMKRWSWTYPELIYLDHRPPYELKEIVINDRDLTILVQAFYQIIQSIEAKYPFKLNEFDRYIKRVFSIVVSDDQSRLHNEVEELQFQFEKEGGDIIFESFYSLGIDDYLENWFKIKKPYESILDKIKEKNKKYEALSKLSKLDFLVVQKRYIDAWKEKIQELPIKNVELISYSDYKRLRGQNSKRICFIGLFGYEHLKSIINSQHKITILLYREEKELLDKFFKRYNNELITEYCSEDRKFLFGIDYPDKQNDETASDVIERLFNEASIEEQEYDYFRSQLWYELVFEDSERKVLDANKSVLLSQNGTEVPVKVSILTEGDEIRVYDNTTKEQLYEIALNEDQEGRFKEIEDLSRFWKSKLFFHYCVDKRFLDVQAIFDDLKSNGLTVNNLITLQKWLDITDRVKFPQSIKDLYAIKRALRDEEFDHNFERIKNARRAYNSIMIALGKDLSEEITNYILTGEKGKILNRFYDSQIREIIQRNAPIRKIKKIKLVENEDES